MLADPHPVDFREEKSYAAVPTKTSRTWAFVKSDIRDENVSTDIRTVAVIHARESGIHSRMKTGIMRTPTVMVTLSSFVMAETPFKE